MPIVQFQPFSSLVQPAFWHALTDLKIDVLRISDDAVPITASYSTGRSITDRETGQELDLGCILTLGGEAFQEEAHVSNPFSVPATGVFKNFNTIEDFKAADKAALFNGVADKIWDSINTARSTSLLNQFLLITFADLKKYKYYYWFAFPAFVAQPAWETDRDEWRPAINVIPNEDMLQVYQHLKLRTLPYFLMKKKAGTIEIARVEDYEQFFADVPTESRTVGFLDPSADHTHPGWPLRNLLAYFRALYPSIGSIRILCWRDSETPSSPTGWKSYFAVLVNKPPEGNSRPNAVGWEKNTQQKLGPRVVDLAPMMDPRRLAEQAVDLNLKLMRWRILPSLNLEKVAGTKCLLLGAGTLGCYVARTLMGWGIRRITFVDSARVSFSNPVRQPLYEFVDCLEGGKAKAQCAADALKRIFPGADATGHAFAIPMPGHPIPPPLEEQTKKDVEKLEALFDDHDAIFLLMDSRESRWLPTVLGAAKNKIVLNVALGFDTFLVMRHGASAAEGGSERLGCYYCNDVVAPADSLRDRTLDQMCTVTRPGLASIASATAVELLVSILQHPDGIRAPAPSPAECKDTPDSDASGSILGLVPHQLRGFLAQFKNMLITGPAYGRCTGCSHAVIQAYEREGFPMLLKSFNDTKYLENLTGLDELYAEGDAVLESVDWDEGEEGEDF